MAARHPCFLPWIPDNSEVWQTMVSYNRKRLLILCRAKLSCKTCLTKRGKNTHIWKTDPSFLMDQWQGKCDLGHLHRWCANDCGVVCDHTGSMLLCKAKRQYLLTCKVSRYCIVDSALKNGIARSRRNVLYSMVAIKSLLISKPQNLPTNSKLSYWTLNPLSPHDALKHHFTSLKTDLIFL